MLKCNSFIKVLWSLKTEGDETSRRHLVNDRLISAGLFSPCVARLCSPPPTWLHLLWPWQPPVRWLRSWTEALPRPWIKTWKRLKLFTTMEIKM